MRLRNLLFVFSIVLVCWSCHNIEDATPAKRNTFIHFYEAAHNMYGVSAQAVEGGYVILGNETLLNGNQNIVLIHIDNTGARIKPDVILKNGYSKALHVASDGYYVIGDSIKSNLQSGDVAVADLLIYSARLFKLDFSGNMVKNLVLADTKNTSNITDIHGSAITINAQNEIIVLGTFKNVGLASTEKPFLAAVDPNTLDTIWSKQYDVIDRDYVNSKSVHIAPSGRIVWASALLKENQNFSRSYIGIPYIKENSTFENFSTYGENTEQQLFTNDIQPAASPVFGFGLIGTYATPTGNGGNMFFIRADQYGSIIKGSERYFDGELSANNVAVNADQSIIEDTGDALISTNDGSFVLAGSIVTTPNLGKGGKDILLIKVDGQGNMIWNKILGGSGDETVSSIRETSDGGLLICGSNNVSGLSSIFIMKTDKDGALKD